MNATIITTAQRLTLIKHLADGRDLDFAAVATGLQRSVVLEIASHHGYPSVERLKRAADMLEEKAEREADAASVTVGSAIPERRNPVNAASAPRPPVAPPTGTESILSLVNGAKAHPSKRIQAAADKVLDDVAKLRKLLAEDESKNAEKRRAEREKAAAKAEVERLKKELAAAQAKLRGSTVKSATKPAAAATSTSSDEGPSAKEIRAWAADNGVDCPTRGTLPTAVREAYDAAHLQQAS